MHVVMSHRVGRLQRVVSYVVVLALAVLVFFVFSYVRPLFPEPQDLVGRIAVAAVLLAAAVVALRVERLRKHAPVAFALFTALCAMSIDYRVLLGMRVARAVGISADTPAGWAVDKLGSSLTIVAVILALWTIFRGVTRSGEVLPSLRIRKGRLALGLAVGLTAFTEELLFRGLFLGRLEPFFGGFASLSPGAC